MDLNKPEYILYDTSGRISEIFCKACGATIAKKQRNGSLRYLKEYAELKMKFDDGSYHVTNMCRKCVYDIGRNSEALKALHDADVDQLEREALGTDALKPLRDMNYKGRSNPKFHKANLKRTGTP